jgi:hypothetical protein
MARACSNRFHLPGRLMLFSMSYPGPRARKEGNLPKSASRFIWAKRVALVTGATGQDAEYLGELLLEKGVERRT